MEEAIKIGAQYGIGGIALVALGYLVMKIGTRMIAAIDRINKASADNAKEMAAAFQSWAIKITDSIAVANARTLEELNDLSERLLRVELRFAGEDSPPVPQVELDFDAGETPPMRPFVKMHPPQHATHPYIIKRSKS